MLQFGIEISLIVVSKQKLHITMSPYTYNKMIPDKISIGAYAAFFEEGLPETAMKDRTGRDLVHIYLFF